MHGGKRFLLKGSIGWDCKCQHFCPLVVTFLSQARPMRRSVSRSGWGGSHCWTGTGKGMWFPERFPASTWEWSSWKRHGAGSTSLLRNTSNPLPGPNVITALTLLLQRGKKSFFQLAAVISPFWSHTFFETWKSCGLTHEPSHKGRFSGTSLLALITKSFWRCQECLWQQKKNELKYVFFMWVPPYTSWFTWNILPQIVCNIWQGFSYRQSWANIWIWGKILCKSQLFCHLMWQVLSLVESFYSCKVSPFPHLIHYTAQQIKRN